MTWPYHSQDEIDAVSQVLRSGKTNYWTGTEGKEFEKEFADYCGTLYGLAVSNGTVALELALRGCEIGPGDEVIVPARTFIATAAAVNTVGAIPVLADISADSLNVTVETIEAAITKKTKAIIVVHYAGWICDMNQIVDLADKHKIVVIEDAAHAHGATYRGRAAGSLAHVGCFSFCTGKIMSTGGEGGMVVTYNRHTYDRMAAFRDHGRYQMVGRRAPTRGFEWTVDEFGSKLRMTEMQAAIGRIQLRKLNGWLRRRHLIACQYDIALNSLPGVTVLKPPNNKNLFHSRYMYLFRTKNRDEVLERLFDVGARFGGCPNIGHEAAFNVSAAPCPTADAVGTSIMSLPVYPTLINSEVKNIIAETTRVIMDVNQ